MSERKCPACGNVLSLSGDGQIWQCGSCGKKYKNKSATGVSGSGQVKAKAKKCPGCGNALSLSSDGSYYFCKPCGKKFRNKDHAGSQSPAPVSGQSVSVQAEVADPVDSDIVTTVAISEPAPVVVAEQTGKSMVQVFALVMSLVCACVSLRYLIPSLMSLIGSVLRFHLPSLIYYFSRLLSSVSLLIPAVVLLIVFMKWNDNKAADYVSVLAVSFVLVLAVCCFHCVVMCIEGRGISTVMKYSMIWFLWILGAAAASCAGFCGVLVASGLFENPLDQGVGVADVVKSALQSVMDDASVAFARKSKSAGGSVVQQSIPVVKGNAVLGTKYGLLKFFILGVLTSGIYDIWMIHRMARDVNIACDGDGKHTRGFLALFFFSLLTCGIYSYVWQCSLQDRLRYTGQVKYGVTITESGGTVLLWNILGGFLCGLGPLVAFHIICKSVNLVTNAYNNA